MRAGSAVVAVLIAACSSPGPPLATVGADSPTPTVPLSAATGAAPTAASPPTTAARSPTPIADVSQVYFSSIGAWRPSGTTLVVGTTGASGDIALASDGFQGLAIVHP